MTAQSSDGAQKPDGQPKTFRLPVTTFLRWRADNYGSKLRRLRQRRTGLMVCVLLSALITVLWAPCIPVPPDVEPRTDYCRQLLPYQPYFTLIFCTAPLFLVWFVAEAVATAFVTPRLRRRREAIMRLLETRRSGYGATPLMQEVRKDLERDDPDVARLLADMLPHWSERDQQAALEVLA